MTRHVAREKPKKQAPVIIEAMAPPDERPVPHTAPPEALETKARPSKVEAMAPPEGPPVPDAARDARRSPDGPAS